MLHRDKFSSKHGTFRGWLLLRELIYQFRVTEYQEPSAGSPDHLVPCVVAANHHAQVNTLFKWHGRVGKDFLLDVTIKCRPVNILELFVFNRRIDIL